MDSVDIFYKLLGIATAMYCKRKENYAEKCFLYSKEDSKQGEKDYLRKE